MMTRWKLQGEAGPVAPVERCAEVGATEDGSDSVIGASVSGITIGLGVSSISSSEQAGSATTAKQARVAPVRAVRKRRFRGPYPCTVATPKIVLFYVFTPLPDPEAIRLWQQSVCEAAGLRGRIIVSSHGINATVGGDIRDVKKYVRAIRSYPAFKSADIKWSDGTGDDFPRLSVKVRPEIVTFGAPDELHVDGSGVVGGGRRLAPEQLHELIQDRGEDVVFLDGRNQIEAEIGRFKDAVVPEVNSTRDFIPLIESGALDHLKGRPVVTYCTGGVRCEVLSALMAARGFDEVYQLDGGIVRYGEAFGDSGLWEGSLYVFDSRMKVDFSAGPAVIGKCALCGMPSSEVINYPDGDGRDLAVICVDCQEGLER